MQPMRKGALVLRQSDCAQDVSAIKALRATCFERPDGVDEDAFDGCCSHVLIEREDTGALLGGFRYRVLPAARLGESYAAQFYDLSRLYDFGFPCLELGRFCIAPEAQSESDVLRLAWAALTREVDRRDVRLLYGCSSYRGLDAGLYQQSFRMLRDRHVAREAVRPLPRAGDVIDFESLDRGEIDGRAALAQTPSLLRTYLGMGGWVSDHAVRDHELQTIHVFTGVEIDAIPENRKAALRALADAG